MKLWAQFKPHHYMSTDLNCAAACFVARLDHDHDHDHDQGQKQGQHQDQGHALASHDGHATAGAGAATAVSSSSSSLVAPAIGFAAVLPQPGKKRAGDDRTIMRESRLVVLPDMQGLGLGPRISDTVADLYLRWGFRFTSKTAHPRFGGYRNRSAKWAAMLGNGELDCEPSTHSEGQRAALRRKHGVRSDKEARKLEAAEIRRNGLGRTSFKQ